MTGPGPRRFGISSKTEFPRHDAALWQEMAGLGWTGLLVPESLGGSDAGMTAAAIVIEGLGAHTTPGPFLSSAVLATTLLCHGASAPMEQWLPALASGESIGAVAVTGPGGRVTDLNFELSSRVTGNGGRTLSGTASFVLDGAEADVLIAGALDPDTGVPLVVALPTPFPR